MNVATIEIKLQLSMENNFFLTTTEYKGTRKIDYGTSAIEIALPPPRLSYKQQNTGTTETYTWHRPSK